MISMRKVSPSRVLEPDENLAHQTSLVQDSEKAFVHGAVLIACSSSVSWFYIGQDHRQP